MGVISEIVTYYCCNINFCYSVTKKSVKLLFLFNIVVTKLIFVTFVTRFNFVTTGGVTALRRTPLLRRSQPIFFITHLWF